MIVSRRPTGGATRAPSAATGLPDSVTGNTFNADNGMTGFGGATLSYDANGNLTSDGTNTYTWDARNHLTAISGAATASFTYDAFGRRASESMGATTTQFLYDRLNPVQEIQGGTPSANLLTGGRLDEYFARTDSSNNVSTLLTDRLGSTIGLVSSGQSMATSYTYQPFGATTSTGAANGNSYQFSGRENDATGLYFYRARYYSPTFQRFIGQDPIGFAGGDSNLYAYTFNNPVEWIDPQGLDVTVIYYPGLPGNDYGHIGVEVNNEGAVGFDSVNGYHTIPYVPVPGIVNPIPSTRPVIESLTFHTTPSEDEAVRSFIRNRTNNPGEYTLLMRDCVDFAEGALRSAGLPIPENETPAELMDGIKGQIE